MSEIKTIQIKDVLFSHKEEINVLGATNMKETNTRGPAGIGLSSSRPASTTSPAKYSAIAKCLDYIFVKKSVNAIASSYTAGIADMLYGEFTDNAKTYAFTISGEDKKYTVCYKDEDIPEGYPLVLPAFLYEIRDNTAHTELANAFNKVKESYAKNGYADEKDVLLCCDSFYYDVARKTTEIAIQDKLLIDGVQQAIKTEFFGSMKNLSGIKDVPAFKFVKEQEKKEIRHIEKTEDAFADIKAGNSIIEHKWTEAQTLKIPSLDTLNDFVPSSIFYSMVAKIKTRAEKVQMRLDGGLSGIDAIGKDYVNAFITGKPGTGKTTTAYALGAALGLPVYTVAMTKNTEEDTFQGMTKVINGNLSFTSTEFLEAYTNGGIIVLEEINLPDPSVVMGAIGQAVEFPFILMQDGYLPVRRNPLCFIIGTMNIGTYGSKGVNQALSSRFKQSYTLDDPKKEDFVNILVKQGYVKRDCIWVYNAYDKVLKYLKTPSVNAEELCLNVTLRSCIGALENMEEGEEPKEAIKNTLLGKIAEADLAIAEDVYKNAVETLPDLR